MSDASGKQGGIRLRWEADGDEGGWGAYCGSASVGFVKPSPNEWFWFCRHIRGEGSDDGIAPSESAARAAVESAFAAWCEAAGLQLGEEEEPKITLIFELRSDGGLRLYSNEVPGLVLSHPDTDAVFADVLPALRTIAEAYREAAGVPVKRVER